MNFFKIVLMIEMVLPAISFSQANYSEPLSGNLVKLPNADASHAIEIKDSIAGPFNVSLGYGLLQEIKSKDVREANSAWYTFTVTYDTLLTFDIISLDSTDEYDFALYQHTEGHSIDEDIKLRQCWSSRKGSTGLSKYASEPHTLVGPSYVSSLPVKKGEVYYLMVSYGQSYLEAQEESNGFMIYFYDAYNTKRMPVVLNEVFFEKDKSTLKKESFPELNKLAYLLLKTKIVILIQSHTFDQTNETGNQKLSEERAKAVADYLLLMHVDKKRIFYKGFGSKYAVDTNTNRVKIKDQRIEYVKVLY